MQFVQHVFQLFHFWIVDHSSKWLTNCVLEHVFEQMWNSFWILKMSYFRQKRMPHWNTINKQHPNTIWAILIFNNAFVVRVLYEISLGFPGWCVGISEGFQRNFHDIAIGFLWYFYGISLGILIIVFLFDFVIYSLSFLFGFCGISNIFPRDAYGISNAISMWFQGHVYEVSNGFL